MRIVNESSQVVPMYWWSNMAVPEYEGGRVIVPADKAFTYADGAVYKVDIPVVDGVDVTEYQNIPRSVDYFLISRRKRPSMWPTWTGRGLASFRCPAKDCAAGNSFPGETRTGQTDGRNS